MGAKYTTLAASGYNSSPPPDDGSQAAANLITWAKHKTKLADPVKDLADSINTALVSAFDYSVRQITTSDSTVAGDHMRCVEIAPTVTTAVTVSLGDAATMTTVYRVFVRNSSAINQTLGRVTGGDTIDGSASNVTLSPGEGRVLQTNSTPNGYLTVARFGPVIDTNPIAVGSADGTKKVRLEVDGLTTATTRVITVPDFDMQLGNGEVIATGRNIAAHTNAGTPNTKLDISADEICTRDVSGTSKLLSSVSVTIDFGTTGANGLDVSTQASSTWYYGWIIAKPDGTVAGLGSTSATAPTMPSGYTFKALVTEARSDGSTHFLKYRQVGNAVYYEAQNSILSAGAAGGETSVSTASFVPPNALAATITVENAGTPGAASQIDGINIRLVTGSDFKIINATGQINNVQIRNSETFEIPNISQNVIYGFITLSQFTVAHAANIWVNGFKLPMGGE